MWRAHVVLFTSWYTALLTQFDGYYYDDEYDVTEPQSVSGKAFAELPESLRSSVRTHPTHLIFPAREV